MPRKPATTPKRGPRIDERLLLAATEVFLENGYSATSIEQIATRAKASKITFYKHFGDKEKVFEAVMRRFHQLQMVEFVSGLAPESSVENGLRRFADLLIQILATAETVKFLRVLQAEAERFPSLAKVFDEAGPAKARQILAGFLQSHMEMGSLRKTDSAVAAEQFMHLALGEVSRRRMLGLSASTDTEMHAKIEAAIDTFMRAYGCQRIHRTATHGR